jgi:hypothetical protein
MTRTRCLIDNDLVKKIWETYPETRCFDSLSKLVDWALNKLLGEARKRG